VLPKGPPSADLPTPATSTTSSRQRWCRCRRRAPAAPPAPVSETVEDLPDGWESAWDSKHLRSYYFNRTTQERSWIKPTPREETVPSEPAADGSTVEVCIAVEEVSADRPTDPQLAPQGQESSVLVTVAADNNASVEGNRVSGGTAFERTSPSDAGKACLDVASELDKVHLEIGSGLEMHAAGQASEHEEASRAEKNVACEPCTDPNADASLLMSVLNYLQDTNGAQTVATPDPQTRSPGGTSEVLTVNSTPQREICKEEVHVEVSAKEKSGAPHSPGATVTTPQPIESSNGEEAANSEPSKTPLVGLPVATAAAAQRSRSPDGSEISWKTASDGLVRTGSLTLSIDDERQQGSLTVSLDEEHQGSPVSARAFTDQTSQSPPREASLTSACSMQCAPSDGSFKTARSSFWRQASGESSQKAEIEVLASPQTRRELLLARNGAKRRSRSWEPPPTQSEHHCELLRAGSPAVSLTTNGNTASEMDALGSKVADSPSPSRNDRTSSVVLTPARAQFSSEGSDNRPVTSPGKGGKPLTLPLDGEPPEARSSGKGVKAQASLLAATLSPKGGPGKKGGKGAAPFAAPPPKKGGVGKGKVLEPRKPDTVPKVPLRKIFWNPINLPEVRSQLTEVVESEASKPPESTVWDKIHVEPANFDKGELEMFFAEAPSREPGRHHSHSDKLDTPRGLKGSGPPLPPPRRRANTAPDVRRLFEEKRRRQIWCMVALLPGRELLPDAIAKMDNSLLSPNNVELLASNLPTEEEMAMFKAALDAPPCDDQPWDAAEDFMLMLTSIPEYSLRIQVWSFLSGFEAVHSRLTEARVDLSSVADVLQDSARIQKLLGLILYVGNYLNGGTPRGRADGFDIDTLLKINNLKSLHKEFGGTLLDYVVCQIEQENPGMLWEMYSSNMEFEKVHCARKHRMNDMLEELADLIKQGDSYLKRFERCATADECLAPRQRELEERVGQLHKLNVDFEELSKRYIKLYSWFQMDTEKMKATDEFFGIWNTFLEDVKKSLVWDAARKKRRDGNAQSNESAQRTPRGSSALRRTSFSNVPPRSPGARSRPSTPRRRSFPAGSSRSCDSYADHARASTSPVAMVRFSVTNPGATVMLSEKLKPHGADQSSVPSGKDPFCRAISS